MTADFYLTAPSRHKNRNQFQQKFHLMIPLTASIIDSSLETLEDFVLGKLKIAEAKFIRTNKIPTRNFITRSAVINNTTTKNSLIIQKAIDDSLQKIENNVMSKKIVDFEFK